LATLGSGCGSGDEDRMAITVQEERGGAGGQVGFDLLVTTGSKAIPCGHGTLEVSMTASQNGGPPVPIDTSNIVVQCAKGTADVAIVVDNSGSEQGKVPTLKAGAQYMVDSILNGGGRASLTRVSTNSAIKQGLTDEASSLGAAVDDQYVNDGWTSIWDGIRMGNETLGGQIEPLHVKSDVKRFCESSRKRGVVAFTDGFDNNSSDEKAPVIDTTMYPGDGINTTPADLAKLKVDHVTTPIYAVGVGHQIDQANLAMIAASTGGTYRQIDDPSQIPAAFADISEYFNSTYQVCADLPEPTCGDVTIVLTWTWTGEDGTVLSGTKTSSVNVPCDPKPCTGREATIVLTLSDPGIPRATAGRLAANAVNYVAPRSSPKVLVVLDDGHHGEAVGDAAYVRSLLAERGYNVTLINERSGGLLPSDIAGYDVVWFSNPGYPWDDVRSVDTLKAFLASGGGVVAQGDDITQSMGNSFNVSSLTHLAFQHNGTTTCDVPTDNNQGDSLSVSFSPAHPLTAGIEQATFLYGDDIDQSSPTNTGEVVVGRGTYDDGKKCTASRPVLSGYQP
jgi:hypothetical protein